MLQRRSLLLSIVSSLPGIRFRELGRKTGLANGTLAYHLGVLERESLLRAERGPKFAEYYPPHFDRADAQAFALIRHDRSRQIITHLLATGGSTHGEITSQLGTALSTASWYLNRLTKMGILTSNPSERQTIYKIAEPARVERLFSIYSSTWQGDVVDRFSNLWNANHLSPKKQKP